MRNGSKALPYGPIEWSSQFALGSAVQRKSRKDGTPPPYRFAGAVCGACRNPVTGEPSAVVSSFAGAPVHLHVLGISHPPVMIDVGEAPE